MENSARQDAAWIAPDREDRFGLCAEIGIPVIVSDVP